MQKLYKTQKNSHVNPQLIDMSDSYISPYRGHNNIIHMGSIIMHDHDIFSLLIIIFIFTYMYLLTFLVM